MKNRVKLKSQNFKRNNNCTGNRTFKNVISLNKTGSGWRFKVLSKNGAAIESTQLSLNLMSKGLNFGHLRLSEAVPMRPFFRAKNGGRCWMHHTGGRNL